MNDRALWGLAEVAEYASIGETRARKLVSQPDFPVPVRLWDGAHPRWIAREVMDYCEARRAA